MIITSGFHTVVFVHGFCKSSLLITVLFYLECFFFFFLFLFFNSGRDLRTDSTHTSIFSTNTQSMKN